MDTIEKIRTKIDRMLDDICEADGFVQKKDEPRYDALAEVLDFLDTLEEEPGKSLVEAAEEHVKSKYCLEKLLGAEIKEAVNDFIAGAKRQKEQMLKDAVEGEYDQYPAAIYLSVPIPRMNQGDKVKLIIVKED